ncbi:Pro-Pol polyprotein, partial [Dictyocoela muelleri]
MNFLIENEPILNLKEETINFEGREYEIQTLVPTANYSDKEITSKTKIFTAKAEEESLGDIINNAKQQNKILGNIDVITHKIELTDKFNNVPKEYRVPVGLQPDVKEHIKELESLGIIKEQESDMISPAFIIKKKNGKLRLVVDYRYLNSITR